MRRITVFPRTGATHRASAKLDHSSAPANSAPCVAAMEGPMEMPVRQPQRGLMFAKRGSVSARVSARVTPTAPEVNTASLQGVAAVRDSANHALKPVSPCGILSVDAMEELMEIRVRQLWPVYRSWLPGPALPSVHLRAGAPYLRSSRGTLSGSQSFQNSLKAFLRIAEEHLRILLEE